MKFLTVFTLIAGWLIIASLQGFGSEHLFTLLVGLGVGITTQS